MATYLGENKSKFLSLIDKQIFEKNITQYDIENEKGEFTGYKVVEDGVSGFAYYHTGGDFYEFSPESDCIVNESRTILLAKPNKLSLNDYQNAMLEERNNETKLVDSHRISFFNIHFEHKRLFGIKAIFDDKKGFVFQEKHVGLYNELQDRTKNYFVKASDVIDHGFLSSKELITHREKMNAEESQKESDTKDNLAKLNDLSVSIDGFDQSKDYWRLKQIITRIDKLDIKKEEITGQYSIGGLIKKVGLIGKVRALDRINNELLSFGITVNITEELDDDKLSISIIDKKGKELSKLSTNKVTFESEDVAIEGQDDTFTMIVLDLGNEYEIEDKYIQIKENGKETTLNKSKFKDVYNIFDEHAHIVNYHSDLDCVTELKTKDGDFDFCISPVDLTSDLSVKSYLLSKLNHSKDLKKSVKNSLKNSSPKLT